MKDSEEDAHKAEEYLDKKREKKVLRNGVNSSTNMRNTNGNAAFNFLEWVLSLKVISVFNSPLYIHIYIENKREGFFFKPNSAGIPCNQYNLT